MHEMKGSGEDKALFVSEPSEDEINRQTAEIKWQMWFLGLVLIGGALSAFFFYA